MQARGSCWINPRSHGQAAGSLLRRFGKHAPLPNPVLLPQRRYHPQSLGFPWQAHVVLAEVKAPPPPFYKRMERRHAAAALAAASLLAALALLRRRPGTRAAMLSALRSSGSRVALWRMALKARGPRTPR